MGVEHFECEPESEGSMLCVETFCNKGIKNETYKRCS